MTSVVISYCVDVENYPLYSIILLRLNLFKTLNYIEHLYAIKQYTHAQNEQLPVKVTLFAFYVNIVIIPYIYSD